MGNKKTVYLTEEGLNDLKNELSELINEKRPEKWIKWINKWKKTC